MAAKNKFMNAMKMPAIADVFSSEAERQQMSGDLVTEVPLSELHPFVNHPFEVRDDEDMQVVSYIVMVEVLPFLGLGFIHRDGYPFEKLVKIYWAWHSENAAGPIRPYKESRNVQKKRTRRNSECETYCRRDEKAARKGRKAAVKAAAQIRKTIRNECRAERPQHQEAPCT